jgi:hypothetical protein
MGRSTAGLLAIAVAAWAGHGPAAAAAAGDKKPGAAPARTPEFVAKVNAAVDKGVLWLASAQDVGGSFKSGNSVYGFAPPYDLGLQALAVYTASACGVPREEGMAKLGLKRLRMIYDANRKTRGGLQNYSVSLTLLALDAVYAPKEEPAGSTRYGRGASPRRQIPDADLAWIKELVAWLVAAQTPDGSFGYNSPGTTGDGWEDHSNAQFSLLALKAARRCGVDVPKGVFRRAMEHFLKAQQAKGPDVARRDDGGPGEDGYGSKKSVPRDRARGWGYKCSGQGAGFVTGSMTAAGVSSLVICRGEMLGTQGHDSADDARVVQSIRDGIAWLGHHFTVAGNPSQRGLPMDSWHFYYLYGLERAGVLAGVSWMADHDWYGEGAEYLLRTQQANGAWSAALAARLPPDAVMGVGNEDLMDTCFALLFLKKATFRVEGAVATEDADEELDLSGTADLDADSFRAVFDTVFSRTMKAAADRRADRAVDFVRMGTRAVPLLIQRLDDPEAPTRACAIEVLGRITGATHGFKAEDPVEARTAAIVAWEEWWFSRRGKLSPDVGAGRFR